MKFLVFLNTKYGYELIFENVDANFIKSIRNSYTEIYVIPASQLLNFDDLF